MKAEIASPPSPAFSKWRVWAAGIRDDAGHSPRVRRTAQDLCIALDSWQQSSRLEGRPDAAQNLKLPLESTIENLVRKLLDAAPPPKET